MNLRIRAFVVLVICAFCVQARARAAYGDIVDIRAEYWTSRNDPCFHAARDCATPAFSISAEAAAEFLKQPCPLCAGVSATVRAARYDGFSLLDICAPDADDIRVEGVAHRRADEAGRWLFLLPDGDSGAAMAVTARGVERACGAYAVPGQPDACFLLYGDGADGLGALPDAGAEAPAEAGDFMGAVYRFWQYDAGYAAGLVRFTTASSADMHTECVMSLGAQTMSADEYRARWGDYFGNGVYSAAEHAYITEMGEMMREVDGPMYEYAVEGFVADGAMHYAWILSAEEYAQWGVSGWVNIHFPDGNGEIGMGSISRDD